MTLDALSSHATYAMQRAKAISGDVKTDMGSKTMATSRGSFTDTSRLNTEENLDKALQQFEGIFVRMMLKEARKASESMGGDLFSNSGTKQFRSMKDDKLADEFAQSANLGIAEALKRQLAGKGSAFDIQQQNLNKQALRDEAIKAQQKQAQALLQGAVRDPDVLDALTEKSKQLNEQLASLDKDSEMTLPAGMKFSGADLKRRFMALPNMQQGLPLK